MSCGVGRRRGSVPVLLWLWRRSVATAPIRPLAWKLPHAAGVALTRVIATRMLTFAIQMLSCLRCLRHLVPVSDKGLLTTVFVVVSSGGFFSNAEVITSYKLWEEGRVFLII